jgi:hypothetical protein
MQAAMKPVLDVWSGNLVAALATAIKAEEAAGRGRATIVEGWRATQKALEEGRQLNIKQSED